MEITEVKMIKVTDDTGKLKAVCSVLIDNSFLVRNIRLIKNEEKYIVAMPSEFKNGKFKDICNPINQETREKFNKAVIEKYIELS